MTSPAIAEPVTAASAAPPIASRDVGLRRWYLGMVLLLSSPAGIEKDDVRPCGSSRSLKWLVVK
jgi:hypothetical protein